MPGKPGCLQVRLNGAMAEWPQQMAVVSSERLYRIRVRTDGGKGGGLSDEAPYPDGSIFQATFSESRPEMNLCKTLDMRV